MNSIMACFLLLVGMIFMIDFNMEAEKTFPQRLQEWKKAQELINRAKSLNERVKSSGRSPAR